MKPKLVEPRFDFSGGRNTRQNPDTLQANELVNLTNWRLSDVVGALVKRTGSRRLHTTTLGGAVKGLYQWDSPGGKQIVAIADGDLHYKTSLWGEFSSTSPTPALSTTLSTSMATARANAEDAPLYLYLADGNLWRWTGSALTLLTGDYDDGGSPPETLFSILDADLVAFYHVRLFYRALSYLQSLYWSVLGDPEDHEADLYEGAGAAMVGVLRGEPITAMTIVGSSLLIATSDSVIRFTGYSNADIQIGQDTEGISNDTGALGRQCLYPAEGFAAMLGDRGLYIVTEESAQLAGQKVDPDFSALDRSALADACVCYHKGRQEIWVAVQGADDTGNQTVYVLSLGAVQAWTGPFTYPFAITCLAQYEDSNGDEWIMAGCSDGFVRLLDTGSLDDVLANGTGGSVVEATAELAPIFFETGPHSVKTLTKVFLQAEMDEGKLLWLDLAFDGDDWYEHLVVGKGNGSQDYRIDAYAQGKRLKVRIRDLSSGISTINGLVAEAFDMQRIW